MKHKLTKVQLGVVTYLEDQSASLTKSSNSSFFFALVMKSGGDIYPFYNGNFVKLVSPRTINCLLEKGIIKCTHIMYWKEYQDPRGGWHRKYDVITDEIKINIALGLIDEYHLIYTLVE